MAEPLKTRGLVELNQLRDRVRRQLALRRIYPDDAAALIVLLNQTEVIITNMPEKDKDGEEGEF